MSVKVRIFRVDDKGNTVCDSMNTKGKIQRILVDTVDT